MNNLDLLLQRYPALTSVKEALAQACDVLEESFRAGGKLMLCGNGGSACDCEHIAGELMKSFVLPRPLTAEQKAALADSGDVDGVLVRFRYYDIKYFSACKYIRQKEY